MNHSTQSFAPLRTLAVAIALVLAAVAVVAVGRRTGALDPDLAKRLGVVVFGVMLAVLGNYLPKFTGPSSTPATIRAQRLAGWIFVLAGGAYVAACLLLPMPMAILAASVIGIGAFVAAGVNWLRAVRAMPAPSGERAADEGLPASFMARRAAPPILFAVFFVFVVFLADTLWGDAVARWMAVAYPVVLVLAMPYWSSTQRRS